MCVCACEVLVSIDKHIHMLVRAGVRMCMHVLGFVCASL